MTTIPQTTTLRPATTAPGMSKASRELIAKLLSYAVLIFFALVMLLPFFWMLSTSLKPERDVFIMPPQWIPQTVTFENYETLLRPTQQTNLPRAFLNSLLVSLTTTIGEVFASTLAGFAFARLKFPGRQTFFVLLLITMMIPGVVTMIPSFILFRQLGWVGTYLPLIIPVMMGTAFAVFLSRQFFATLPAELEEAAKIDGANMFQIYWRIFLPLAQPIIATLFVLGFIARWNDYLGPLIYLGAGRPEEFTIPLALASLQSFYQLKWTILMAGSTLALLPIIVLFFLFQRYFVESIAITGIKG